MNAYVRGTWLLLQGKHGHYSISFVCVYLRYSWGSSIVVTEFLKNILVEKRETLV